MLWLQKRLHSRCSQKNEPEADNSTADLDPQVKKMAALRDQLVHQALATTLKVRELLTPEQLAEAAKKKNRLRELGQEMRSLLPEPEGDPGE